METALFLFEIETAPVSFIWGFFLVMSVLGFFLVRLHPIFLLPILSVLLFIFWGAFYDNYSSPFVGEYLVRQEENLYVVQSYVGFLIGPAAFSLLGIPAWFIRRKKVRQLI